MSEQSLLNPLNHIHGSQVKSPCLSWTFQSKSNVVKENDMSYVLDIFERLQ